MFVVSDESEPMFVYRVRTRVWYFTTVLPAHIKHHPHKKSTLHHKSEHLLVEPASITTATLCHTHHHWFQVLKSVSKSSFEISNLVNNDNNIQHRNYEHTNVFNKII